MFWALNSACFPELLSRGASLSPVTTDGNNLHFLKLTFVDTLIWHITKVEMSEDHKQQGSK